MQVGQQCKYCRWCNRFWNNQQLRMIDTCRLSKPRLVYCSSFESSELEISKGKD